jgi:O-antigen ligase
MVCVACGAVVGWLFATNTLQLRTRVQTLAAHYEDQADELGIAGSRTRVWADSMNTIIKHPFLGIRGYQSREAITSGYAETGFYLSHNVFMDYGRYSGIPGLLFVAFFFFYPLIQAWRTGAWGHFLPFLLVHLAMLIFWLSLSFQFYKTFWGFWMLMALAAVRGPAPTLVGSRRKVRSRSHNGAHSAVRPSGRSQVPRAEGVGPASRPGEIKC